MKCSQRHEQASAEARPSGSTGRKAAVGLESERGPEQKAGGPRPIVAHPVIGESLDGGAHRAQCRQVRPRKLARRHVELCPRTQPRARSDRVEEVVVIRPRRDADRWQIVMPFRAVAAARHRDQSV